MDAVIHQEVFLQEGLRDKRGVVIGRIEHPRLTGKSVARNARGRIVGVHDPREGLTRDAFGKVIARGNILVGLLRPW